MKKTLILLVTGVISGLGLYLYNKKEKKVVTNELEPSLEINDYVVYIDDEVIPASSNDEMFI